MSSDETRTFSFIMQPSYNLRSRPAGNGNPAHSPSHLGTAAAPPSHPSPRPTPRPVSRPMAATPPGSPLPPSQTRPPPGYERFIPDPYKFPSMSESGTASSERPKFSPAVPVCCDGSPDSVRLYRLQTKVKVKFIMKNELSSSIYTSELYLTRSMIHRHPIFYLSNYLS